MWGRALLLLLLLQHSKSDSACKNLRCFADYIRTLTCTLDAGPGSAPREKRHDLVATWDCGHRATCAFLPAFRNASHTRYTCSSEQKPCTLSDTFAVMVTTLVDGALALRQECGPFQCHRNIKPRPPFNVTAVACPGGYNVSWESGYNTYDYLHGELQYQLRYRLKGRPWSPEAWKPILQDTPTLWLLPQELDGGADYELQVRAGPRDHSSYKGTWSDWSPTRSLRTPPRGTLGATWGEVAAPLLAFSVLVALLAFLCKRQRPWKKLESFIPSPAPFFQALYLVHNGDFKKWVGTACSGVPLDVVSECSPALLLEVFRISPKPYKLPTAAPGEASVPAFTEESPGSVLEPGYGHLSIDTVTVADAGALEPEEYRCLPLDGSPMEESLLTPFGAMIPPALRDSGSWHQEACLALLWAGAPPGHRGTLGGPLTAASPPSPQLSPSWAADGDSGEGGLLDLDTVDSGFAGSDCGSPVDCECGERRTSCAAPGEEEGAAFLPSYVKQWVTACHLPPAEHG